MGDLKYVIFFIVFLFGVPFNYKMALKYEKYEKLLLFLLFYFTSDMTDINFVSREHYRGTSKGFEIGMVDILLFSLLALVVHRKEEHPLKTPPGTTLYFLYVFFGMVSMVNSADIVYSLMEIWKELRMYLGFYVLYNYITRFEQLDEIMLYISFVTIKITIDILKQKYILHMFQCMGSFPHQNSMVMYMIVYGGLLLAYVMNKPVKIIYWLPVFGGAGVDIVSSLSRGGMAMFAIAIIIIFMLSHSHSFSLRKLGITILFILGLTGILYKAMDSITERIETAPEESANVRVMLAKSALNMANDKILGIGLNNFAIKVNPPYPYSDHIPMPEDEDVAISNGLVETIYLNIAAETGWHNLVVFFLFIFYFYFKNMRNYFRLKGSIYRYFPLGLIGGLLAIYLQSTLEWVLKQTNNYYQLMFMFAIIAAISRLLDEGHYKYVKPE